MSHTCKTWLRRGAFAALACVTLLGSGCLPGVVWLPDSSGFIYVARDGKKLTRLVHFDVATKKARTLAEKIDETAQPALSPDGKRIAVAKYTREKDKPRTLQVVLLDAQGKEVSRSKEFEWKAAPAKGMTDVEVPPALYWSPQGDKIVVYCETQSGLYDVKTETMNKLPDTIIVNIAGTPILPDKSGILGMIGKGEREKKIPVYALIDWQGKVKEIKNPPDLFPKEKQNLENEEIFFLTMLLAPPMHSSRWDKGVAEITFSGNTVRIDTVKMEVGMTKADQVKTTEGKLIRAVKLGEGRYLHSKYDLGNGVTVRTVILEKKKDDKSFRLLPQQQVELLLPGQKEPKVLVEDTEMVTATPSPNGEWLVLRCVPHEEGNAPPPERILLISRKGEVTEVSAK
jgi:hypothetical protein